MNLNINANDPHALSVELREAWRRNFDGCNVRRVLDACDALMPPTDPRDHERFFVDIGRIGPEHALSCVPETFEWYCRTQLGQVRDALRWAVDFMADVMQGHQREPCERIANMARMLPNPQPMGWWCGCGEHGQKAGYCLLCGVSLNSQRPAPTHALRLYIDALQLAKGDGWYQWLYDQPPERAQVASNGPALRTLYFLPHEGTIQPDTPRVSSDGTIECGEHAPEMPEVL